MFTIGLVGMKDWIEENLDRLIQLYEHPNITDKKNLELVENWRSDSDKRYSPHAWLTRMRHDTFARNLWQEEEMHQTTLGLTLSNYQDHQVARKFLGKK